MPVVLENPGLKIHLQGCCAVGYLLDKVIYLYSKLDSGCEADSMWMAWLLGMISG